MDITSFSLFLLMRLHLVNTQYFTITLFRSLQNIAESLPELSEAGNANVWVPNLFLFVTD